MEKNVKKRDANIELLRIVAMFMVITLHCLGHGLLVDNSSVGTANSIIIKFLDTFSRTANAIFIIITGYYYINKQFDIKKILILWGKTLLYSILFFTVFKILGKAPSVFQAFFPILAGQYWFITAYISLFLIMPVLNLIMNKLTQKQSKYLLIVLLIIYGVIRTIFNPSDIFNGAFAQMTVVYMLGAYIRKYVTIQPKKQYFIKYVLMAVIITILYVLLNALTIILPKNEEVLIIIFRTISLSRDYITIFYVYMTVLIFMKFKTMQIKSNILSKIITFISPSVFSIYIIHENVNIRDTMWLQFGTMNYANSWVMIPHILLSIISVFITCLLIDLIRRGLYYLIKKIPFVISVIEKLNMVLNKCNTKINAFLSE